MAAPAGATIGQSTTSVQAQVRNLRQGIGWHRATTWHYQDEAGVRRTPTAHAERRTSSIPFLRWIDRTWSARRIRARAFARSRQLAYTRDWLTAVSIVQRDWPGTAPWLRSCSHGEGGWGGFVMNHQGSGAGGWMQFMSGTFYSEYDSAHAYAQRHRLPLVANGRDWHSALGQAFAAGWARLHSDYRSTWSPSLDSGCA